MREYWIGWSVIMLIVWVCILLVSLNPKDANAHLVFLACLSLAHIIVGICAVVNCTRD